MQTSEGGSCPNTDILRMQASRQKPNYEKGLNWKYYSRFHTNSKGTKKKSAPMQIDKRGKYLRTCK